MTLWSIELGFKLNSKSALLASVSLLTSNSLQYLAAVKKPAELNCNSVRCGGVHARRASAPLNAVDFPAEFSELPFLTAGFYTAVR